MLTFIAFAFGGGILVGLSRQINGRLSLSTGPLVSSFWNHFVGFVALTAVAQAFGGLFPKGEPIDWPWLAFVGGPLGVVFVASSSWLISRLGAAQTAVLVIAGQMLSSVIMDIITGAPGSPFARIAGVALILGGILVGRKRKA